MNLKSCSVFDGVEGGVVDYLGVFLSCLSFFFKFLKIFFEGWFLCFVEDFCCKEFVCF